MPGIAGQAQAATSSPNQVPRSAQAAAGTTFGPFLWYVYEPGGDKNCIVTNGTGSGNQLSDSTGGCAHIKLTSDGTTSSGDPIYLFTDGNGNCVRANSSDVVKLEKGKCDTSDTGEKWILTSCTYIPNTALCSNGQGSKYRFENELQKLWMKTTGDSSGDKVWVGTGGANEWDLYPVAS